MFSRSRSLLILTILLAGPTACGGRNPTLSAKSEVVMGESLALVADGLEPGVRVGLSVDMTDTFGRAWHASAEFEADAFGRIDLATATPLDGPYSAPDPFALLAAMTMPSPPGDDWEPPAPVDYNELVFRLSRDGTVLDTATSRQWVVPPGATPSRLGGDLVAELFLPNSGAPARGVLLLGGSGGGMAWGRRNAALLAREGYATMALSYFNDEGLPAHMVELPLEYVERALDSLKARPGVRADQIAVMGYSKGAELALLIASRRPDVGAVVAIAPGSAAFQGFRPPDYPVVSTWSVEGAGTPFVPNAYDDRFFETYDGMYLWYRTLAQHDEMAAAAIPVERINGDILLLSGVDDRIWPSTLMGEQIVARLGVNEFEHSVRHLAFPEAGHAIAVPSGEPLTASVGRNGGTVAGNLRARTEGWAAILAFLGEKS
jgi:dienelactone hydrolase